MNEKRKFLLYGVVTGTKYLGEVEAASAEEARDIGLRKAYVSLCHQCADEVSDAEIQRVYVEEVEESA